MGTEQDTDKRCETCEFFGSRGLDGHGWSDDGKCYWESPTAPERVGGIDGVDAYRRADDGKLCPAWEPSSAEKYRQKTRDQLALSACAMAHAVGTGEMPLASALANLKFDEVSPAWREAMNIFRTIIHDHYPEKWPEATPANVRGDQPSATGNTLDQTQS